MPSFELQTLPPIALSHSVEYDVDGSSRRTTDSSPDRASLALNPGSQLAPVDRGRNAWIFLICATALETLCWGLPFSVGVLHSYWTSELFKGVEGSESILTLAATLQTGLLYVLCVPAGPILQRWPWYRAQFQAIGLLAGTAGFVLSAFAKEPWHLLVCLGILYPISVFAYLPAAVLLFEWFQERRGLASGIMYSGTGIGGTVFPFIMQGLLNSIGYKWSMITLGLGFFVVGGLCIPGCKPRLPVPKYGSSAVQRRTTKVDWSFFKRSPFYAFTGAILFSSLGNFIPSVWIPTYAQTINSTPDGATLVALMNAASIVGLILLGIMTDRMPLRFVVGFSCFGSALSCLALWGFAGHSSGMLLAFVITFGLLGLSFSAVWTKLITVISKDNPNLPPLIFSLFALARGCGNISSGPLASALLKSNLFEGGIGAYGVEGGFGALLLFSSVSMVVGAAVGMCYRS